MKAITTIIIMACFMNVSGQNPWKPTRNDIAVAGVQMAAGALDGIREEFMYHPNEFFQQHPNLNRQYWDSRISWKNKANTWVVISDANHLFRAGIQSMDLLTVGVVIFEKKQYRRKDWWKVAARKMVIGYLSRKAGFALTYNLHFKNSL